LPPWAFALLVFVLTLVSYGTALQSGWIWDDDQYVTHNRTLVDPGGLLRMWTVPTSIPQWYPLVHTTFWLEYNLFGLHPWMFHLTNVLLHAASALLLGRVVTRLHLPGARFTTLLFALHPVQVESVAWVTERKNCLSLLCALGAFLCWMRFQGLEREPAAGEATQRRPARWWWAGLGLFIAALLSKSVTASLPAAALVVLWARRGRITARDVVPLLPWFVIGIGLGLHTAHLEKAHVGAVGPDWDFSFLERVHIAGRALCHYAHTLVWPVELMFIYPKWTPSASEPRGWLFVLVALAVPALLWVRQNAWGRWPLAAFLLWAGILFPALGFLNVFPFRYSFVADHFQYHATTGLIALGGAGLAWLHGVMASSMRRWVFPLFFACLGALTFSQGRMYADEATLWRVTLARNPDASIAWNNMGSQFLTLGRVDEAERVFAKALELDPRSYEAWVNLGSARLLLGREEEALACFDEALKVQPEFVMGKIQRAAVLGTLGRRQEGIRVLEELLVKHPAAAIGRGNLAVLLREEGRQAEAEALLRAGLVDDPWEPYLLTVLGQVLIERGQFQEAVTTLENALRADRNRAVAWRAIGRALFELGDGRDVQAFERATTLENPPDSETWFNLGNSLLRAGRAADAEKALQRAILIDGENLDAWRSLAHALENQGREDDAAFAWSQAAERDPDAPATVLGIGLQHARLGRWKEAVAGMEAVLRVDPSSADALDSLAWIRAACPDPSLREPAAAVTLAERLVALKGGPTPSRLDTLAIALASAGRMPEALTALEKAAGLPGGEAGTATGDAIRRRRDAFLRGELLFE
jgi:tetratricopeptide (TPR) repeat protein